MMNTSKTSTKADLNRQRFLSFSLGNEKFAIPLLQVKEVIGNLAATPVPKSPDHFKGIINLRGQIISIIDLRTKLQMGRPVNNPESAIIILDFAPLSLGVVVDSVDCVAMFEGSEISAPPSIDPKMQQGYIVGVARKEQTVTLILDLKAVLNTTDYAVMQNHNQNAA